MSLAHVMLMEVSKTALSIPLVQVDANVQCFTDPTLPAGQALTAQLISSAVQTDPDFINVNGATVNAQRTFSATGTVHNPSTNVTLSTTV